MRKKLTLMFVALLSIAAFAATQALTQSRRAAGALIDFPTSSAGIQANGTTLSTTVENYPVFQLKNGYTGNNVGNNIALSVDGGFKKGDVVTVAGFIKNADASKYGTADLFSATGDAGKADIVRIYRFENFPNLNNGDATISEQTYTLTQDYDILYIGRYGNTNTNLTVIKVTREPVDIEIAAADITDGDITAAIAAKTEGVAKVGNLTINLDKTVAYKVTASIVVGKGLVINGNGATIDASALSADLVQWSSEPVVDKVESGQYLITDPVTIQGIKVTGLTKAIIGDKDVAYAFDTFTIDDCVFQWNTQASVGIDFSASMPIKLNITNSTFYSKEAGSSNFMAISGKRPHQITGYEGGLITLANNTFYNIAKSKQLINTNTLKGQKADKFAFNKNIFVDCSNKKIFANITNNTEQVSGELNTYWYGGETYTENYRPDEGLATDPKFKDAANGDFTIDEHSDQAQYKTGDPRWLVPYVGIVDMGAPTDPIDVVVPATEGEDGTATDLATFLDGCLENSENPAYIKLTLQGGAKYTISKPIETISSISIIANEGNPAIIDASALKGALIQVNSNKVSGNPNEKGYYTNIEAVNIKNINVTALNGELFNAAGAKYLIPTLNIENVYVEENGRTIIDMNGSALDEFNVSKSTFFAPAGATFYKAGAALETAGVGTQVVNISYNTLYKVGGFNGVTNDDKAKTNIDFNHNIVVEYPNFIAAMNADLVTLLAQNNSFQQLVGDIYEDISNAEEGATNSIVGNIAFANDPTTGDFALAACDQKTEKIGDPRWLVAVKYITNDDLDAAGDDIAVAINNGIQEGFTKFQLQDNTRYEARQSIVADKGLILAGKNVKIEVLHNDPFILLSKSPAGGFMPKASTEAAAPALNRAAGVEYTDYYKFDELTLSGLKVNGLKNSIIYDNNVKYCVIDLTIDDCVMQLETEAVKNEALIAFQAGGVNNLTIKNSTFYGNNGAKYFVRYNNSARIDRFGFDKADDTWSFTYENNTFYKTVKSDGQWGNYSGIVGKNAQGIVTVKNNIWYNCDAQTMRRMLGSKNFSQFSKASLMENNTFFVGGEAVDQGNYGNGSDLTSDPGFERPAVGNFTLSAYSQQFEKKTGDPRWYADGGHYNATGIEGVEAEKADDGAWYTIQGVRVDKPAKGLYIHNGKKIVVK